MLWYDENTGKPIRKFVLRQTQGEAIAAPTALGQAKDSNQPITSSKRTVGAFLTNLVAG